MSQSVRHYKATACESSSPSHEGSLVSATRHIWMTGTKLFYSQKPQFPLEEEDGSGDGSVIWLVV